MGRSVAGMEVGVLTDGDSVAESILLTDETMLMTMTVHPVLTILITSFWTANPSSDCHQGPAALINNAQWTYREKTKGILLNDLLRKKA